jgi:hypothetical protein
MLIHYRCDITIVNKHASTEHKNNDAWNSFHGKLENVFNQFLTYHIKIELRNFNVNAKVVMENIFKTSGKERLNKISNDIPPKRQFMLNPHGITSLKMAFCIVTAVKPQILHIQFSPLLSHSKTRQEFIIL